MTYLRFCWLKSSERIQSGNGCKRMTDVDASGVTWTNEKKAA